jgi:hypothetical protein
VTAVLAAIRPDEVNLPLLLHVLGALALVGGLVAAVAFGIVAWRSADRTGSLAFWRLHFRTLLFAAFPAWWVMRIAAQWVYSEEGWDDLPESSEPGWLGIGYITADLGGILILVALILAGLNVRKQRRSDAAGSGLGRAALVISAIALLAYIVAVWAMSAKPD